MPAGCPLFDGTQLLTLSEKVLIRHLAKACQEICLAFAGIEKSNQPPISDNEVIHLLAARDTALPRLEAPQKRFHFVVCARQARDLVAGK